MDTEMKKKFLTNQFGDRYLYEVNGHSFDQAGASTLFAKTYGDTFATADTFYLVAGTDSGLLMKHIAEQGVPEGSRFLFVELPEIMALPELRRAGTNDRIALCTPDQWLEKANEMGLQGYLFMDRVQTVCSLAALGGHDAYVELTARIQMEFDRQRYLAQASLGSKIFVQRQLENVADCFLPARTLRGRGEGKSCVLLAGGPSLDDLLPWLKRHWDRFVIIAVSRIAGRLRQEGLRPDIWCSIDPWAANLEVSREMLDLHEETLLVHANHVYPPLLGQWQGKSLYLGDRFPWKSRLDAANIPIAPLQVTNSALTLAIEMGFSRIILGGVDFCYRDGLSHASGSLDHEIGPSPWQTETRIETNGGGTAETTFPLASAADVFDRLAEPAREKGITLVNPAPGAARLRNVDHVPLERIPLPPPLKKEERRLHEESSPPAGDKYLRHQRETLQELSRMLAELNTIRELSNRALKCHTMLCSSTVSDAAKAGYKRRMDRIEKRLRNRHAAASYLIKSYGIHSFLKMGIVDREREWSEADIQRVGEVYYHSYRETAGELIGLITAARRRVLSRIEEQREDPDFPALFHQWRQDAQPGRSLVWKRWHRTRFERLPQEVLDQFAILADEFHESLEKASEIKGFADGTSYRDRLERHRKELGIVPPRLDQMFRQRNEAGLAQTIAALEQIESRQASRLAAIARGYLAELRGRPDEAMEHYLPVVQEEPVLPVLLRISDISLERGDYPVATLALEVLSGLSPRFLPSYANILRLTGRQAEALEAYHRYLNQEPDDLATVIAVGKFYLELDAPQAATDAFNYVLARDPGNRAARTLLEKSGLNRVNAAAT